MGRATHASEAVLDIAARLIVDRGLAAITLGHVAEEAGVGEDVMEAAFHRKECLLTAIVDRAAALFTCPLDERPASGGDHERIEALLIRQLAAVDENRALFLVAILKLLRPTEYPGALPPLASGLSRLEHYLVRFDEWLRINVRDTASPIVSGHVGGGAMVGVLSRWAADGGVDRAERWSRPLASMLAR